VRVLLALDKFKGSLGAARACQLAARALRERHRDWQLDLCPLTDGGEGFAPILTGAAAGRTMTFPVAGPRGGLLDASLGLVNRRKIPAEALRLLAPIDRGPPTEKPVAVVEMAAASGLGLLADAQRDPWQTTTYGTGQLLRAAAELGAAAIVLGVGGSATNDLGTGALSALGLEFRTAGGAVIRPPAPAHWAQIAAIEGAVFPSIPPIAIACDVTNPLLGPAGAAAVFGPQKGLPPGDLARLESAAERMAGLLCAHTGQPRTLAQAPGAGAAGGLSFGLMVGARARLVPGFALVSAWLGLSSRIAAADLIVTGEGCFDESSLAGKGPGSIIAQARALGKPFHVFAGALAGAGSADAAHFHAITPPGCPFAQARREAPERLMQAVAAVL
jgi:glycerate kinase